VPTELACDPGNMARFLGEWAAVLAADEASESRRKPWAGMAEFLQAGLLEELDSDYGDLTPAALRMLISAVFNQVSSSLNELERGNLAIEDLGKFRRINGPAAQNRPLFVFTGEADAMPGSS